MRLSEAARGRDNNFNLIRFCAAIAVLMSHSFALALGHGHADPLFTALGLSVGSLAVNVFFVTSGFLVAGSLLNRQSAVSFIWARSLRIFPALWVVLVLTVFGLGLSFTADPHYLASHETWRYLLRNAVLFRGVEFRLPGVFTGNPRPGVNGSLWTLQPEVEMYATLLALWLICVLASRPRLVRWLILAVAAISGGFYFAHGNFDNSSDEFTRLAFMFFTGSSTYVFKDRISLSRAAFFVLLAATLIAALNRTAFFYALNLTLPYLVFYTAYGFKGAILSFNRLGDYSYGIYIYAFPVQQTIAHLVRGISVADLMGLSAVVTLALAALSWHLIEKRALKLKDVAAQKTRLALAQAL